jgi:phage host-nuclease inhibitor protein Gam
MSEREEILESLEPLFEQAEKEKLWFYCSYQDMWFSPRELKDMQKAGRFVWGAVNWTLRDPLNKVKEIEVKIENLRNAKDNFIKKIEEEI